MAWALAYLLLRGEGVLYQLAILFVFIVNFDVH